MAYTYVLKIICGDNQTETITRLLDVVPSKADDNWWEYEIHENVESDYIDYVSIFLNILRDKYEKLEQVGVTRDCISIWVYYEYDQQCNMEFLPNDLENIGSNGISLCISCWQK